MSKPGKGRAFHVVRANAKRIGTHHEAAEIRLQARHHKTVKRPTSTDIEFFDLWGLTFEGIGDAACREFGEGIGNVGGINGFKVSQMIR